MTNIGIGIDLLSSPITNSSNRGGLPSELKDKIVSVWRTNGITNDSVNRDLIKDLTGKRNDIELVDFAYKLNSSRNGLYKEDFLRFSSPVHKANCTITTSKINLYSINEIGNFIHTINAEAFTGAPSYTVYISNIPQSLEIYYRSLNKEQNDDYLRLRNGLNILPTSEPPIMQINGRVNASFYSNVVADGLNIIIEQIPEFKGAVITDGIDDMLFSAHPNGNQTNYKATVISMVRPLSGVTSHINNLPYTNNTTYIRTNISNVNKDYIVGYTIDKNGEAEGVVILGDKDDITTEKLDISDPSFPGDFSIVGTNTSDLTSIVYYGGFVANNILTIDEINQVIAHYKLDWWIQESI